MDDKWYQWVPVLAFATILWVPVFFLLVKAITAITSVAGWDRRALERERRDRDQMVERLIEKLQIDPPRAAMIHAQERGNRTRMDAGIEHEAIRSATPGPMAADEDTESFAEAQG